MVSHINAMYLNNFRIIAKILNEHFTKNGWCALDFEVNMIIHMDYLNMKQNIKITNNYEFRILVLEKYLTNYINSQKDIIIINDEFYIKINNISIYVKIKDNKYENHIYCLNGTNVFSAHFIENHLTKLIELGIANNLNMLKLHSALKISQEVVKITEEKNKSHLLPVALAKPRSRPINNFNVLLDAAKYIEYQNTIEPPAKRR